MITVVDTGGANLASVMNAFERLGQKVTVSADPDTIAKSSRVLFPGVGAAKDSMDRLQRAELVSALRELRQPTLGICLGMQLFFERSEEGNATCLGILPGTVHKIPQRESLSVPHMGWNQLARERSAEPLLKGICEQSYFYFVHSFVAPEGAWVSARFDYGSPFPAMVAHKNYFGVQFHPEKSAKAGEMLLRNFINL